MTKDTIDDGTDSLRIHFVLSVLTVVIGVILLVFMVTTEDEPGAIPLALLVGGTGWLLFTRARARS